mmetsp:Transcript_20857/g.43536  ORF Transcript_20857/g.43536 Transcript_20857/m.43536 type:complete len:218 (-) Transcript_20857:1129-1782(-)
MFIISLSSSTDDADPLDGLGLDLLDDTLLAPFLLHELLRRPILYLVDQLVAELPLAHELSHAQYALDSDLGRVPAPNRFALESLGREVLLESLPLPFLVHVHNVGDGVELIHLHEGACSATSVGPTSLPSSDSWYYSALGSIVNCDSLGGYGEHYLGLNAIAGARNGAEDLLDVLDNARDHPRFSPEYELEGFLALPHFPLCSLLHLPGDEVKDVRG